MEDKNVIIEDQMDEIVNNTSVESASIDGKTMLIKGGKYLVDTYGLNGTLFIAGVTVSLAFLGACGSVCIAERFFKKDPTIIVENTVNEVAEQA